MVGFICISVRCKPRRMLAVSLGERCRLSRRVLVCTFSYTGCRRSSSLPPPTIKWCRRFNALIESGGEPCWPPVVPFRALFSRLLHRSRNLWRENLWLAAGGKATTLGAVSGGPFTPVAGLAKAVGCSGVEGVVPILARHGKNYSSDRRARRLPQRRSAHQAQPPHPRSFSKRQWHAVASGTIARSSLGLSASATYP